MHSDCHQSLVYAFPCQHQLDFYQTTRSLSCSLHIWSTTLYLILVLPSSFPCNSLYSPSSPVGCVALMNGGHQQRVNVRCLVGFWKQNCGEANDEQITSKWTTHSSLSHPYIFVRYSLISCLVILGSTRKVAVAGYRVVAFFAPTNTIGIVGIHMRNWFATFANMLKVSTYQRFIQERSQMLVPMELIRRSRCWCQWTPWRRQKCWICVSKLTVIVWTMRMLMTCNETDGLHTSGCWNW